MTMTRSTPATRNVLLAAIASVAIFSSPSAFAQTVATVHGHVTNPAGQPFTPGDIKFTKDRTVATADLKFAPNMVFPIDASGNYTATGIGPGDYFVFVTQGTTIADRIDLSVKTTDTDLTLNDDMTRDEYIKSMTPEARKNLEEYKKKNASTTAINAVIGKLNTTLKTVQTDLAAAAPTKGDVSADVAMMKEATDAKADEPVLWTNYGNTLLAQGDHLAAEDRKAGKPVGTDPDAQKTYAEAVDAFKKGVDLDAASKKPNPVNEAAAYNQMGNALAHAGKGTEASAAFEGAVKLSPANAGLYYKNEAVVLYNAGQYDQAVIAADKAIAADPKAADAYYIKAQSLVTKTTTDKAGKMIPPPGCVDAYQAFLQLAPSDPKAPEVKVMIESLGEKVQTKFKIGR
jgi:tetratricopeptide (TPR) repeat protein